jgi:hypothetical protein
MIGLFEFSLGWYFIWLYPGEDGIHTFSYLKALSASFRVYALELNGNMDKGSKQRNRG